MTPWRNFGRRDWLLDISQNMIYWIQKTGKCRMEIRQEQSKYRGRKMITTKSVQEWGEHKNNHSGLVHVMRGIIYLPRSAVICCLSSIGSRTGELIPSSVRYGGNEQVDIQRRGSIPCQIENTTPL